MSRRFLLTLAALLSLAPLARSQDMQQTISSSADTTTADTTGDNLTALKAQNAVLKKEVSDAKTTITQLQAKLTQANAQLEAVNVPKPAPAAATASGAAPDVADAGPKKALPLDATNVVSTPGAPGAPATDAGASRTYTVVKGDSLWKIAHKEYPGDTKNGVDKLTEANKDTIAGKPLKIGQVLVVPQ